MRLIAITGGIGSGKSVVSRVLRLLGYDVVDSDALARRIMNTSSQVQSKLVETFGTDVVVDGEINRERLAAIVFGNDEALSKLNAIVHPAVIETLAIGRNGAEGVRFVETALLYGSGMREIVDGVWRVEAPLEQRVSRVIMRSSLTRDQVLARIEAQQAENCHDPEARIIVNDGKVAVIPQIVNELKLLNKNIEEKC